MDRGRRGGAVGNGRGGVGARPVRAQRQRRPEGRGGSGGRRVTIDAPAEGAVVGAAVTLKGRVDGRTASSLVVAGEAVVVGERGAWEHTLRLRDGAQEIVCTATDEARRTGSARVHV